MERVERLRPFSLKRFGFPLLLLLALTVGIFSLEWFGVPTRLYQWHFLEITDVQLTVKPPLNQVDVATWLPELKGKNVLFVSPSAVIEKLKTNPWIGEVAVRKEFPDRIEIQVEPKKPVAIQLKDGVPFYLDEAGIEIAKVAPGMNFKEVFPVINFAGNRSELWQSVNAIEILNKLKSDLPSSISLSEISFSTFPLFRVFLISPPVEVIFNYENWESQRPFLVSFLKATPLRFRETRRINLTLAKKAVVSLPVSQ